MVDLLDFPIDPPDGARARLVQGFEMGRRGGLFHAGEDWVPANGASFGASVHSVGHGQVTYAAPRGWGADQGVVIVQHTFSDGSTILSFYGHLHPLSVVLQAGECVVRGQPVGTIGRPRTPPHLHFEMRSHMPTQPGPGYWRVDPVTAGWQPPSLTIWRNRLLSAPGVQWVWSPAARFSQSLGMLDGTTFVVIEDRDLVGINVQDGSVRWRQPRSDRIDDALLDAQHGMVTVVNQLGQVEAYGLSGATPRLLWTIDLDAIGIPVLMPLPEGGVMISMWQQLFGVSGDGTLLWTVDFSASLGDWALTNDQLLFLATGLEANVWAADQAGVSAWEVQMGGRWSMSSEGSHIYGQEGIYGLDPVSRTAELRVTLPRAYPGVVDMVELADGGLLMATASRQRKDLVVLNSDATPRWQRSFSEAVAGLPRLFLLGSHTYALFRDDSGPSTVVRLFTIDMDTAELTHIFTGGTGSSGTGDVSALALDGDRILIDIAGTSIVALDTRLATEGSLEAAATE